MQKLISTCRNVSRLHVKAIVGASLILSGLVLSRQMMAHILAHRLNTNPMVPTVIAYAFGFLLLASSLLLFWFRDPMRLWPTTARLVAFALLGWLVVVLAVFWRDHNDPNLVQIDVLRGALPYIEFGIFLVIAFFLALPLTTCAAIATLSTLLLSFTVIADALGIFNSALDVGVVAPRPGGILGNRNYAGEYLGLATPLLLAFVAKRQSVAWILCSLPVGLALCWTRSRTGWLAAGVSAALVLYFIPRLARKRVGLAIFTLALGAMFAGIIPNDLHWQDESPYTTSLTHLLDIQSGSGAFRLQQYRETLVAWLPHWWQGLGLGQWKHVMLNMQTLGPALNRVPHSDYLRWAADLGLFGLCAAFALFAALMVCAWKKRAQTPEIFAFLCALGLICLADVPFYRLESVTLVAFLSGNFWRTYAQRA